MPLILGICGGAVALVVLVVAVVWLWPRGNESAGPPAEQLSRAPLTADPKPKVEPKSKPKPKLQPKPKTRANVPPETKPATQAEKETKPGPKPKTKTQGEAGIRFPSFGIAVQVPKGWKIISAKDIKTDIFIDSHQKQADQYVKKNPSASCFIQKQVPGDVRPTICLIPGAAYIKNTPESGAFIGGTSTVAGTLASQLAWLASFKGSPAKISSSIGITSMRVASQQQLVTEIKGDKVTLIGLGIAKRWRGPPVTIGLAAPPNSLEETKGVVEEIVRQIEKGMGRTSRPSSGLRHRERTLAISDL